MDVKYTAAVGTKFFKDGSVRHFPGSSMVCNLDPSGKQHQLISNLLIEMSETSFANAFAILPASSLHMTVFDLLCDEVRVQENWSSNMPLDMPLEKTDEILNLLQTEVMRPSSLSMKFHHFELEKTIGTVLVPADKATQTSIFNYREALSKATGIRHPNHDTYFYHISMAYILRNLSVEEEAELKSWVVTVDERLGRDFGELELSAPELVLFPDMTSFPELRK